MVRESSVDRVQTLNVAVHIPGQYLLASCNTLLLPVFTLPAAIIIICMVLHKYVREYWVVQASKHVEMLHASLSLTERTQLVVQLGI